jgi:hypothetical protein
MRLSSALLLVVLAAGCTLVGGGDQAAPASASIDEGLATVAEERRAADAEVDEALAVTGDADDALSRVRRPAFVAEGIEEVRQVVARLEELDPSSGRAQLRTLATSVDDVRTTLAAARERADDEPWEATYLHAQDQMLQAVREHAAAGDAVLQLIERHRPAYLDALDRAAEVLAEELDPGDADDEVDRATVAGRVEEGLAGMLEPLELAREELETFQRRRQETRQRVNETTADAATVFDQRPGA